MLVSHTLPRRIHLIGAGGIGVSAIGTFFAQRGAVISGTDIELPPRNLLPPGEYREGHHPEMIVRGIDLIVYSDAVPSDDPERVRARELQIPEMNFAKALGAVTAGRPTIAISGTHGKSTTTALTGLFFEAAGLDPSVFVGAVVPAWEKNVRLGTGPFIVEADEYREHMMELSPITIAITNLEWDHPDYYRDSIHVMSVFSGFLKKLGTDGIAVINVGNPNTRHAAAGCDSRRVTYALDADAELTLRTTSESNERFRVSWHGTDMGEFSTLLPGRHNKENIACALATFLTICENWRAVASVLETFRGIGRRFEEIGMLGTSLVVSDYAHHPTALDAVVHAAYERYQNKRILFVFRPHQMERTRKLFDEYVRVIQRIPDLLVLEVYDVPGRSSKDTISSRDLLDIAVGGETASHHFAPDLSAAEAFLRAAAQRYDVIVVIGAGDADKLARALVNSAS
jgi:UDP-N-acetylmuramate--alanine ligase